MAINKTELEASLELAKLITVDAVREANKVCSKTYEVEAFIHAFSSIAIQEYSRRTRILPHKQKEV